MDGPRFIGLDEKDKAVRIPEGSLDIGLSPKDHRQLLYSADAQRLGSARISSVRKRKPSSSTMVIGRQSKKTTRKSYDEGAKIAAESAEKLVDFIHVTMAASSGLKLEAESAFQMSKVAMKEYCFVKDTCSNELGDLHKLKTGFALHRIVSLVLPEPLVQHSQCAT